MQKSETISELAKALSKMQGELKSVSKDSTNPFYKMRYASLDAIWDTVRKPLSSNGLSVIQTTYELEDKIYLETVLLHTSSEWVSTYLPINALKQEPQAIGSAITYARRYSLSAILGISADEDDDAEGTTEHEKKKEKITPSQQPKPQADKGIPGKEHWCKEHNCEFRRFEKGDSHWYSHSIGDTGKWCNEEKKSKPVEKLTPEQAEELFGPDAKAQKPPATPQEGQQTASEPKADDVLALIKNNNLDVVLSDIRWTINTVRTYLNPKYKINLQKTDGLDNCLRALNPEQRQEFIAHLLDLHKASGK